MARKRRGTTSTEGNPTFTEEQEIAIKLIVAREVKRIELTKKIKVRTKKQVMTGRGVGVIEKMQKVREEKEHLALAGTE